MKNKACLPNEELRSEIRQAAARGAVVEFKPARDSMMYQLALRDWSPSGLGILVKKGSKICQMLEVGQVLPMTVRKGEEGNPPEHVTVEIRHITDPLPGQHPEHCIVGLYILDRIPAQ